MRPLPTSGLLKRLDVTSRSLIAVIEPGSCFAGLLLELALACDRQYMLDGRLRGRRPRRRRPAAIVLTAANDGPFPMGNGLTRLASRGSGATTTTSRPRAAQIGEPLDAAAPTTLGLVTLALDDIDFEDELRIVLEERASLSPGRADRHGGQPPVRRPGDDGDQGLRPAHRLAELDLHPAQRLRARGGAAPLRHRPAGRLRRTSGSERWPRARFNAGAVPASTGTLDEGRGDRVARHAAARAR